MKSKFTQRLLILITVLLFGSKVHAQSEFKDRFFFSNGFSIFTEAFFGKTIVPVNNDPYALYYYPIKANGLSYFTYTPNFRYNLSEFDDNSSLSINVPIGIGLMTSEFGFGDLNFPIFISYNVGNVSTYKSDKNKGFTIGIGFEYYNMALFKNSNYADGVLEGSSWVEPCVNIGYRYWNSKNLAKEFNLKLGFGPGSSTTIGGITYDEGSPLVVKLTWFRYLKY